MGAVPFAQVQMNWRFSCRIGRGLVNAIEEGSVTEARRRGGG